MADRFLLTRHGSPGFITTPLVVDLAIATAKLADLGVTTAKLADLGVATAKIADLAVATAKVADRAVTAVKQDWLTQVGSKASGAYWVYPVAYAAAPIGAGFAPAVSHGAYPLYISRLVAGSCVPVGSPGAYLYVSVTSRVT